MRENSKGTTTATSIAVGTTARWLGILSASDAAQFCFVTLDELIRDPEQALKRIGQHLGYRSPELQRLYRLPNEAHSARIPAAARLLRSGGPLVNAARRAFVGNRRAADLLGALRRLNSTPTTTSFLKPDDRFRVLKELQGGD